MCPQVSYHEAGPSRDDSNTLLTPDTHVTLRALLPGRNYSVGVSAVSRGVPGDALLVALATRPLAPALLAAQAAPASLALAWRSDVNSRQDRYELRYRRYRPGLPASDDPDDYETVSTPCSLSHLFQEKRFAMRDSSITLTLVCPRVYIILIRN